MVMAKVLQILSKSLLKTDETESMLLFSMRIMLCFKNESRVENMTFTHVFICFFIGILAMN